MKKRLVLVFAAIATCVFAESSDEGGSDEGGSDPFDSPYIPWEYL